ncbi:GntR family transcriptional regulator [Streptomyces sp. NPDC091215]|uniref:GntR family transcriptional regulator n=1 Tax=Streptomyces sp. NPDC091215 TaxID=3155192 RepID=UPI0034399978
MPNTHAPGATAVGLLVDRASPRPLHQQLAEQLRHAIEHGRLAPGTRLISETELARQTGLSRITVRHAVASLTDEGLLVRRRGVGTYVAYVPVGGATDLTALHDDLRAAGSRPVTDLLSNADVCASAEVADALAVPEGSPVTRLERLQHADGEGTAYLCHYLPVGRPRLDAGRLSSAGLYAMMQASGITVRSVRQAIGARRAGARESELLGIAEGSAVLTMRRTMYDHAGRPVEHATHCYPASRRTWDFRLLAQSDGPVE